MSVGQGTPICVIKVGGSLLNDSDRWPDLGKWLDQQPSECHYVVMTGGGPWADAIRALDADGDRSKMAAAHWLAVRSMSLTARLVASLERRAELVEDWHELQTALVSSSPTPRFLVFDPAWWLRDEEQQQLEDRLPLGWDVTSDSIAAHLANRLYADELILLKSIAAPADESTKKGATFVDPHFAHRHRQGRLKIVNFREGGCWFSWNSD